MDICGGPVSGASGHSLLTPGLIFLMYCWPPSDLCSLNDHWSLIMITRKPEEVGNFRNKQAFYHNI